MAPKRYTVPQAAAILGISRQALGERCITNGIGVLVSPRCRVLSADDLKLLRLRTRKPGRLPNS